MSTPSVEYRTALDAVILASVATAAVAMDRNVQYVIPKDTSPNAAPSRQKDIRVITNHPTDLVKSSGTLINSGDYKPWFLATVPGIRYEARIEAVAKLRPKAMVKYLTMKMERARRLSFGYVEGGHIVSIRLWKEDGSFVSNWKEFADVCGLVIGNSAKISKRLKEVVRLTRMFVRLNRLGIRFFEEDHPDLPQKHVDGATLIRRSVALKACLDPRTKALIRSGAISRVSIRVITPQGLIKGDALIVPDKHIKSDIYTSKHNLKEELRTKEGFIITMEPHHPSAPARTNDQLLSWFSGLFPLDQLRRTVRTYLAENLGKLANGEYPTYLVSLPQLKDGVDPITIFRMAAHKWLSHGRALNESAALMLQAGNAITKQLITDAPKVRRPSGRVWTDFSKQKVRVPIVHAFYGHFMTDVVIRLAGYHIPKEAEGKLFFHKETGSVVIPADHFERYYRNHGGWDLDDSAMVIIRKIDGIVKAIIVRSPNSWGEYSVIDVHLPGLPLYFQYGEIPAVSSEVLPTQIQDLELDDPDKDRSLPSGTFVRGAEYGYEDFDYALRCAAINPGTGSLINLFCIAYNAIFGTHNRDPFAETEDVVDTTQQNPSLEGLAALLELRDVAKDNILAALSEGQEVDRLIFERRLNLSDDEKNALAPFIKGGGGKRSTKNVKLVDGMFTQLKDMVREEIKLYSTALNVLATHPLGEKVELMLGVNKYEFWGGRAAMDFSGLDFSSVRGTEEKIWERYRSTATAANDFKLMPEEQRALWQGLNRSLVKTARNTAEKVSQERADLTLMNFLNWTYVENKKDSALFSTPAMVNGELEVGVIDLLLDAMVRHGLTTKPE